MILPAVQYKRRMLPFCLGFTFLLGACHSPTGSLRFHLSVPQSPGATQFSVRAIPAETTAFEIQISGQGLDAPLVRRFEMGTAETQTQTISQLPTGPKNVKVQALMQDQVLAEASQSVEIKVGELNRVDLDLVALIQQVRVKLDTPLPLDFELDLQVRGEGLSENFQKKLSLKAGQTELDLGVLPPGNKEARITFRTQADGREIFSETLTESFDVAANGQGTLDLQIENVLASYSAQLEVLLDRLPLLQVLAILGQLNTDQLRRFLERLPQALRARLLTIPQIRARLEQAGGANPSVTLQPQPAATPAVSESIVTPSASPTGVLTKILAADVRLVFQKPEDPALLMASEPIASENSLPLIETETQEVPGGKVWGLVIRSADFLPAIPYELHLKTADMQGEGLPLGRDPQSLNQFFVYQNLRYRGGMIPFRLTDQPIDLEAGQVYLLRLSLTHPEINQPETRVYRIRAGG